MLSLVAAACTLANGQDVFLSSHYMDPLPTVWQSNVVTEAPVCMQDEDCYGGRCESAGTCTCPPIWTGPTCQSLRLKPTRLAAGGLRLPNTSSWGGASIQDPSGKWHLFAARIEANCGLHSWSTNSDIVHATAPEADGPYTLETTVLPAFSHGPAPTVLPDGQLLIVHLGCGNRTQQLRDGCTNGSTPTHTTVEQPPPLSLPPGKSNCDRPAWTGMITANLNGQSWQFEPSSFRQRANWSGFGLTVAAGEDSWHSGDLNGSVHADNPSIWPLDNGSLVMAYATKLKHPTGPDAPKFHGRKQTGVAMGEMAFKDGNPVPFRDLTAKPIFPYEAEDPTIFYDSTNTLSDMRWHILAHRLATNTSKVMSAHAVAASPRGPWKVATEPAYDGHSVEWVDESGTVTTSPLDGRERPHIIFDNVGRPVALSTGTTVGRDPTPITPEGHTGDYSFTHVQMLDPAKV